MIAQQPQDQGGINPLDALALLNSIHDQQSYTQALQIAVKMVPQLAQAPQQYNPQMVQQLIQQLRQSFPDVAQQEDAARQQQAPQQQSAAPPGQLASALATKG